MQLTLNLKYNEILGLIEQLPIKDKENLILSLERKLPNKKKKIIHRKELCGFLKGKVSMADDFNEAIEDFKEYM